MEARASEQKQLAQRERRSAAKYVQESRQKVLLGDAGSVRREKAEVEALKAMVEKLRAELSEMTRRANLTEKMLQQVAQEAQHKAHCFEEEAREKSEELLLLWRFMDDEGLNVPASVARLRPAALLREERGTRDKG